jgi:hypothetical protein
LRPGHGGAPLATLEYNGVSSKPMLRVTGDGGSAAGREALLSLSPGADGLSTVRLWFDGSVIEILVDGREAVTLRDYSEGEVEVALTGAAEAAGSLQVYAMTPISRDRLTT